MHCSITVTYCNLALTPCSEGVGFYTVLAFGFSGSTAAKLEYQMQQCRYLQMAYHELCSAQQLIENKAKRHAKEMEERQTEPQQRKEWLLKQLEADKASRKDK